MPVERNRRTNISGSILEKQSSAVALTVTLSTDWSTDVEAKDVDPKVGDYYYKDGTWSSDLKTATENPVIGVVFKVNDDGKTGSVVSLTEPTDALAWAVSGHQNTTGANALYDGKGNTDKVFAYINSTAGEYITNYPIFEACKTQRTETGNNGWYIPVGYSDLFRIVSGTSAAEQINAKITAAGGTELVVPTGDENGYWTSMETNTGYSAHLQRSATGSGGINKGNKHKVRFFLDF